MQCMCYLQFILNHSFAQYEDNFSPKVEEEAEPDDEEKIKHSSELLSCIGK